MSLTCIQCCKSPAKFKERFVTSRVFCGHLCQREYHLIGLKDGNVDYGDNTVGLEANDCTWLLITLDQAREMTTIENLLEDVGPDNIIPLHSTNGTSLLKSLETTFKNHCVALEMSNPGLFHAKEFIECHCVTDIDDIKENEPVLRWIERCKKYMTRFPNMTVQFVQ